MSFLAVNLLFGIQTTYTQQFLFKIHGRKKIFFVHRYIHKHNTQQMTQRVNGIRIRKIEEKNKMIGFMTSEWYPNCWQIITKQFVIFSALILLCCFYQQKVNIVLPMSCVLGENILIVIALSHSHHRIHSFTHSLSRSPSENSYLQTDSRGDVRVTTRDTQFTLYVECVSSRCIQNTREFTSIILKLGKLDINSALHFVNVLHLNTVRMWCKEFPRTIVLNHKSQIAQFRNENYSIPSQE